MWLIRLSLRNPYLVATLVFTILIAGFLCLWNVPIDILPVSRAPAVQVLTYFPGMPASSIEKTITNRIERWVNQAPGARLVESQSLPGVSVVKIYFRDDIDPNEALTLTNSLALGALPNLPPNTLPPVALPFDATGTLPVGILTISNRLLDDAAQKDLAKIQIRNMLGAVPGCIAPVVVGGQDRTVLIYLDQKKMEARNLAPMDVVAALKKANLMATPGTAYLGNNQVLLDSNAMLENVDDFNKIPITLGAGTPILLGDIARAEDSAAIQTSRVRIADRNEVYVPIYRQRGASSLAVANGVRDHIPFMEERLPQGTRLEFVMDQTESIRGALVSLLEEGIVGALLVSLMILLFLGNWRMTLIATLSIPISLFGAIVGIFVTGNTINAMTLGGMALAIGPLVDDAIVELENNHRNHQMGKSRVRAALDGGGEVMIPVLVATCTTVIVLAPLALMPGMGGFLFRPLTFAVGFAMVTSFLLSRTFVPMMCGRFLPEDRHIPTDKGNRIGNVFQTFLDRLTAFYLRCLDWALGRRVWVLCAVGILFLAALGLLPGIGREFFPAVDSGQITLFVRAPSNSRLDQTERRVIEVEAFIKSVISDTDRAMIVSEIGLNPDWSAAYTANAGQQDATIRIQLKPRRSRSSQEYALVLREKLLAENRFADLRFSLDTGGMVATALNDGAKSPIDIEIEGGTVDQSLGLARRIRDMVAAVPGTADTRVHQRKDAPYLVIDIDREKAATLGLAADDVILQVVVAMNSSISVNRNFWIDSKSGNQYFVGVQYPENPDLKISDILDIPVRGANQPTPVNLGTLVKLTRREDAVEVNHSGLRRVSNVLVNTRGADIGTIAGAIHREIRNIPIPEGMHVRVRGEYARMEESLRQLLVGLGLAGILVYLLQVSLFRSWTSPLVIMFTVPFGFIGVLVLLYLSRTTINVQSLMGIIFLVGIAVNNGVLLVDFANNRFKTLPSPLLAIREAASIRFRPILMTFLATVLALTPMAIGSGRGNEANIPLARAVVGGMISSTFLTLFLIPILYTLLIRRPPGDDAVEAELARDSAGAS